MRNLRTATKRSPHSPQLEKARAQQQRPNAAKDKLKKKKSMCKNIYPAIFVIASRWKNEWMNECKEPKCTLDREWANALCIFSQWNKYYAVFFFFFGHAARLLGSQLPHQGLNLGPRQWKCWILTTKPPGNSWCCPLEWQPNTHLLTWEDVHDVNIKSTGLQMCVSTQKKFYKDTCWNVNISYLCAGIIDEFFFF